MPHRGGAALLVRNANPADMLRLPEGAGTAGGPALPDGDFTVEAFVLLESIYPDASVRVIASRWDGKQDHAGWSLGVTSEKSKHQPRNLILQLSGDPARGGRYEVVPSNLRLELHRTYYVAASVKLNDTSEAGVTFYVKNVSDMDAPLRSAGVKHAMTAPYASKSPLMIGGRDGSRDQPPHGWDGLIGEVRLSSAALKPEQLLWNDGKAKESAVAYWQFEEHPGVLKDTLGLQPDLVRGDAPRAAEDGTKAPPEPPMGAALIDLCHALLNSNEFLYVD